MDVLVGCASNLIAKIGEKLIAEASRHLGYVLYYNNYIHSLEQQVEKLMAKSEGIKQEVDGAVRNGETIAPEVNQWLSSVDIIFKDSKRFLESEVPENKGLLNGRFPNIKKRYMLSKKAKKKTEKAAMLKAEAFSKISYPAPPPEVGDRSLGDFKDFESRMPTINQLMKLLKDDTTQIISICGMGGSGKSTMVKEVARRVKVYKLFDEIVMAVVSKEHNLMKVQEDLAKWLGLRFKSTTDQEGRANELWRRLLQSKKGNLVILDDVWKHIDLKNIGIPIGEAYKNCKVVLTSRSQDACKAMGCSEILTLDVLTPQESWSLLSEMVGDSLNDPELSKTAPEIATRCGGLPIAIVCLGRALKDKTKEVWNDTLLKLKRSVVPSNIEGMKEEVYQSLQVSYDLLGDDDESKKLFLLCCLYPEYANVPLESLVRCGIGLEFFQGIHLIIEGRDRVYALTDKLKSRFLLLIGDKKSTVKVHNVVRAVGISVASRILEPNKEQCSAAVIHEDNWPRGMEYERYNAISVVSSEISEFPSRRFSFQQLELLQLSCPKLSVEKLNTMFMRMEKLRVLELWNMSLLSLSSLLFSLPREIIALCLDCKMEKIGNITIDDDQFLNLEILSFGKCEITELPIDIAKFTNLRMLDMSGCRWLERISPGVISSLSRLEELDTGSKLWGDEEEGDASLTELESLKNLIYLGIRIKSSMFLPKNPLFEKLQRYVISVGVHPEKTRSFNNKMLLLKLEGTDTHLGGGMEKLLKNNTEKVYLTGDGMKATLKELDPGGFLQVKNLTIEDCKSESTDYLSDYTHTNGGGVFINLEKLRMEKIWHLRGILHYNGKELPSKSFSRLRKIHLSVLPEITHLFTHSVAKNLMHLQTLRIEYCTNMQQVVNPRPSEWENTTENKIVFPKLTELIVNDASSLICFSHGVSLQVEFPQLKVLKLEYLESFHTFCPTEISLSSKSNYKAAKFQSLVDHKVEFPRLAELTITNISNIKEVWCGHDPNLVHLQGLYIQICYMMEEVISIQRQSVTTMEERIVFRNLKEMTLFGLTSLKFFCRGIDHVEFPELRVLRLRWLTHFQNFCPEESSGTTSSVFNDKVSFPNLETLEVSELDNVEELWSSQLPTSQFGKLKSLRVEKCHRLVNIFPFYLQTVFPSLEKLEVEKCDSLEQVWGPTGEKIRKLKSVFIHECPKLRNLCSFYTFKGLSNLQILHISSCKMMEEVVGDEHKFGKMKEVLSLNNLEEVKLSFLLNLNYFSHNKCDIELPELTHVTIKRCPEMYTFSESAVTTPKLESVVVDDVRSWSGDLNTTVQQRSYSWEY